MLGGQWLPFREDGRKSKLCILEMHCFSILTTTHLLLRLCWAPADVCPTRVKMDKYNEITQGPISPNRKRIAFLRHVARRRLIKHKMFLQRGQYRGIPFTHVGEGNSPALTQHLCFCSLHTHAYLFTELKMWTAWRHWLNLCPII